MLAPTITTTEGDASTIGFAKLPIDIILHMCDFLDINDKINLLLLTQSLHRTLSTDPSYWQSVLKDYTQQFYPEQGLTIFKNFVAGKPFDALAVVESLRTLQRLNALVTRSKDKVSALEQQQHRIRSESQHQCVQPQVLGVGPFGGYVHNTTVVSHSTYSNLSPYNFFKSLVVTAKKKRQQQRLQALEATYSKVKGEFVVNVPSRAP